MNSWKFAYMVKLIGTRAGWPENMTTDEERIMGEHFLYLKDLVSKKKVVLAGPVNNKIGLIILQVENQKEAIKIMNNEPSVLQSVHTYEMLPMKLSLLMDHSN